MFSQVETLWFGTYMRTLESTKNCYNKQYCWLINQLTVMPTPQTNSSISHGIYSIPYQNHLSIVRFTNEKGSL